MKKNKLNYGFTLVELLIVITIVGILSGILTSIVNPVQQRKNAEDGIRRSNMNKLVMGIEAYNAGEGSYPTASEQTDPASKLRSVYLQKWPDGEPTSTTSYSYSSTGTAFGLVVNKAATTGCIKYRSDWGKVQDCTDCSAANSNCTTAAACTPSSTYGNCGGNGCPLGSRLHTTTYTPSGCNTNTSVCEVYAGCSCATNDTYGACGADGCGADAKLHTVTHTPTGCQPDPAPVCEVSADCTGIPACSTFGQDCDMTPCCTGMGLCEDYSMGRCNCQYTCSL